MWTIQVTTYLSKQMYNKLQSMFIAEKYHRAHNFHTNMKQQLHFKKTRKKKKRAENWKGKQKGNIFSWKKRSPESQLAENWINSHMKQCSFTTAEKGGAPPLPYYKSIKGNKR